MYHIPFSWISLSFAWINNMLLVFCVPYFFPKDENEPNTNFFPKNENEPNAKAGAEMRANMGAKFRR
jgi:hypothetical protein